MRPAPKDITIIATFTYCPLETIAIWNPVDHRWVYANLQSDLDRDTGKWCDNYFESCYAGEDELTSWRPLENKKKKVILSHKRREKEV